MEQQVLSDLYKLRFARSGLDRKNQVWRVICNYYLQKFVDSDATVIDLACGYGEFLNHIRCSKRIGIDLNPDSQRFLDRDVVFHHCEAENVGSISKGQADVVFTSNFLEHLPDKKSLGRLLEQVFIALKPGGQFIILGPNLRYLPGRYWDFYDHHLGLTHLSLGEALRLQGLTVDFCLDRFLPYTTLGGLPNHPWLVRAYLKMPLAWKILGKQFLLIASKPQQG